MLERYLDSLLFEMQDADSFLMAVPLEDRDSWDHLSIETRQRLCARADARLTQEIPPLYGTGYISFNRVGLAADYERSRQERRDMLRDLVMGSCVQPDGRYDMKLADIVWAVCEESSWVLPRNNPSSMGRSDRPLPDIYHPHVDAGAAETAADLAMAAQMAASRLDEVSPQLMERMEREVENRVIQPFLTLPDTQWMVGPRADSMRCLSGCTLAFLTWEHDNRRRWNCMRKAWMLFDRMMSAMPSDGSVASGLEDWMTVVEPIMDMVMMVYSVSRGRVDVRGEKQIQLLCHFPVFCHVARNRFVNPGRRSMCPSLRSRLLYRVGVYSDDSALCDLGVFLNRTRSEEPESDQMLLHRVADLFNAESMAQDPMHPPFRQQGYFAAMQLMEARMEEDSEQSLALAVWGGSNALPGCHADAGNFVLFCGGDTVLADAAFLEGSQFHNLPAIGGQNQVMGSKAGAQDVTCRLEEDYAMMSMDLTQAYPAAAGLYTWQRTLIYERDTGMVQLMEVFDLRNAQTVELNFITPCEPELGRVYAQLGPVRMRWEAGLSASVQTIEVPDEEQALWGRKLYRLTLSSDDPLENGKLTITFNALRTFG